MDYELDMYVNIFICVHVLLLSGYPPQMVKGVFFQPEWLLQESLQDFPNALACLQP